MEKFKGIIYFIIFLLFGNNLHSASTSPSQTVPKIFEDIEKEKIKKQGEDNLINGLDNIKIKKDKLDQISIVVNSLVIIASQELQNIISFKTYNDQLIGKTKKKGGKQKRGLMEL